MLLNLNAFVHDLLLLCLCLYVVGGGGGGGGDIKAYEDWIQQAHNQNQQVTIEE